MNKKLIIIVSIGLVIVAAAAFVGGRFLNGSFGPMGLIPFGPGGGGPGAGTFSMAINMTPAPELPTRQADLTGLFTERKDNTITVQSFTMDGDGGGGVAIAVHGSSSEGGEGPVITSSGDMGNGPKTEVVVTGKTIIYRDSTEMLTEPPTSSDQTITMQQTVEIGTLDDIRTQTMVMVWGRKVGDRLIAEIIMYSNPIMIQK